MRNININTKLLLISIFLCFGFYSYSQDTTSIDQLKVLYYKEYSAAFVIHSSGWGFTFRKGKHLTGLKKKMLEIELVKTKHSKEIKTINPYFDNSKSYVYGKLNELFNLRTGIGIQKIINTKPYWGGVEVRYFYYGGISLGLTKPVYLDILNYSSSTPPDYDITTERYDPNKHFMENICSRAAFTKGLDKMSIYPGIYGKFGFNFEYGSYNKNIKALEVGTIIDAYPKAIPIMAFNTNNNIFLSVYFSFHFGKRYNK